MATAKGEIKRSKLSEFQNLRANGLKSFDIEDDDRLCWVHLTSGRDEIVMATEQGQAVCFPEAELRASGRASGGVRGISIEPGDRVVGVEVARPPGGRAGGCQRLGGGSGRPRHGPRNGRQRAG